MKRKVWNLEAVPQQKKTGFFIRVAPKSGSITLSGELDTLLDTKFLNFIQDEERPGDWYLEPSANEDGNAFPIRSKKVADDKKLGPSIVQNVQLAREILKSVNLPEVSTRFMVANQPIEGAGFAILTKSAKQSQSE